MLVRKQKYQLVKQAVDDATFNDATMYAIARFVFGKNRAIEASVVDLVSKGILTPEHDGRLNFYPSKVDPGTIASNPLASNLLHHHSGNSSLKMKDMLKCYHEELTYHRGLEFLYKRVVRTDYLSAIIIAAFIILAVVRINQGTENNYPVTYLGTMCLFTGFILLPIAGMLSSRTLLQKVFKTRHEVDAIVVSDTEPLIARFVFLGMTALTGTYAFAHLESTFGRYKNDEGTSAGSCGSSGCGSSCGGSGCGGCGGGD